MINYVTDTRKVLRTDGVWVKSSHSESGACVEVSVNERLSVRDSKDPHLPGFSFDVTAWSSFILALQGYRCREAQAEVPRRVHVPVRPEVPPVQPAADHGHADRSRPLRDPRAAHRQRGELMQRDHAAQAICLLLADAQTTTEINAIARVARRGWFLWQCPTCRQDKYPNRETCCGNPRPDDPWED